MARYLLALFALQALGSLFGLGTPVDQFTAVLGGSGVARAVAIGIVAGQIGIAGIEVYEHWKREREERDRLRR